VRCVISGDAVCSGAPDLLLHTFALTSGAAEVGCFVPIRKVVLVLCHLLHLMLATARAASASRCVGPCCGTGAVAGGDNDDERARAEQQHHQQQRRSGDSCGDGVTDASVRACS
jgi:hypothetical protein